jgi:hypothetical protein
MSASPNEPNVIDALAPKAVRPRLRRVLPIATAAIAFISWLVANVYEQKAEGLARSLAEMTQEIKRDTGELLIVQLLNDLRPSMSDEQVTRCQQLRNYSWIANQSQDRDQTCAPYTREVAGLCSAEEHSVHIRVETLKRHLPTMLKHQQYMASHQLVSRPLDDTIQRSSAITTVFDNLWGSTIGTTDLMLLTPGYSCVNLDRYVKGLAGFHSRWDASPEAKDLDVVPTLLLRFLEGFTPLILKQEDEAEHAASAAHWLAIFLAGLSAVLLIAEKWTQGDRHHR